MGVIGKSSSSTRDASADRSTAASDNDMTSLCIGNCTSSPKRAHLALEAFEIKNTFVHFRDVSADERVVQSMPRGMFKRCLLEEAAGERVEQETASAVLPTVVSTTVMASGTLVREEPALGSSDLFATGTEVVIQGLL